MSTKRCKVHYRRLRRDNGQFPDISLSSAISAAMATKLSDGSLVKGRVVNRITEAPGNTDYRRLLNNFHSDSDLVFGDLCLFSPGQMQALLQLSADEDHAPLEEVMKAWNIAEAKAPDGTEYLHGMTYWMVTGDHFYQIQHVSLQTKPLEEYFTWLLRDKTKTIGKEKYVELKSEFDRAQIGDDLGDLTSIDIGGLVPETVTPNSPVAVRDIITDVETKESLGGRVVNGFQAARKILVDLLGEVGTQKIFDTMPPEAALEVTVNIAY